MATPTPQKQTHAKLKVQSWGDVAALSTLFAMFLGVVAWGLKLEFRNDQLSARVEVLEQQVGNGVLPRAEERIIELQRRVTRLEDRNE